MKLILRFSISIIKDWSSPPSLQVSPRIIYVRSKHSGAEQMVDIHRSSDGGLDVRNPHAMELADSVNSEFFAPVGNILLTSRETEDLGAYWLPALGTPAPDGF